jgi:hypothetical protein
VTVGPHRDMESQEMSRVCGPRYYADTMGITASHIANGQATRHGVLAAFLQIKPYS